ncbi:MAG: transposase [Armatimonadota bacterium]|nr:transposase [Armatimonadota bacterium]
MPSPQRRRWTAEEKLQILEEARAAGGSVSEVCRRHQLAPGQFYLWERQGRQGALQALRDGKRGRKPTDPVARLQAEIDRLRVTVAELSTENLQLKKGLWP